MKFFAALVACASAALAQNAAIGYPTDGQKIEAGSDAVVQIQRPNSLTGSKELQVAIGIASCASSPCLPSKETLGTTVLYSGDFKPVYHESGSPPYQNYTVKIPSDLKHGKAQINVAHFSIMGASNVPFFETLNQTVVIN